MRKEYKRFMKYFQWKNMIVLLFLFVLASCMFSRKTDNSKYINKDILPGVIKVGINLYFDECEVNNLDWLEYNYWTKRIYGPASAQYKASLPDTNVWLKTYKCLDDYPSKYFRSIASRHLPVVGITQKQAEAYSKWRSDRVFEYLLIRYGIIKISPAKDSNSCFTIERYYAGQYKGYKPDSVFKYYPCYRLPTVEEWKEVTYSKPFIDKSWSKKRKARIISNQEKSLKEFQSDIVPCLIDSLFEYPIVSVFHFTPNDFSIYNLRGNVSEWTSEKDISVGGGWQDCRQIILKQDTFIHQLPNAYTGFRNVCEWKEWRK
jgi:hypothetical protein